MRSASAYADAFMAGLRPDRPMGVAEWSNKYRYLTSEASAEPGRYSTERTPYVNEILDCLSPGSPVEEVVVEKGAQIGLSEAANCWIGFIIDRTPAATMIVQPTKDLAKDYSKLRLKSVVDSCPAIAGKVKESKSRDGGNTTLAKEFKGGYLFIGGANSAATLCSKPIKYLVLDEVDRYPISLGKEGDPVALAKARTRTYKLTRKIFQISTPVEEHTSRIHQAYETSDKRRFHLPCPHCGHFQWLKFSRLRWPEGQPEKAVYVCEGCEKEIEEYHKTQMLAGGKWIAQNPGARGGKIAGFHISSLYSPYGWYSWGDAAGEWLDAQKDPTKLKTFTNTVLGEVWKEAGESPPWEKIYERREKYPIGRVPDGVCFLTAGTDVQRDRLEVLITGWGRGKQSWTVDRRVIMGDTSSPAPWSELSKLLDEQFEHASGAMLPIRQMAIDSGFNTQMVYSWARKYPTNRVIATKGSDSLAVILAAPSAVDVNQKGKRVRRGFRVWRIGASLAKAELYGWLRLEAKAGDPFPPGYCHFPELEEDFFRQLTAEELTYKVVRGYKRPVWVKKQERNEVLDCWILSRAAATAVGMDRFRPAHWERIALDVSDNAAAAASSTKAA